MSELEVGEIIARWEKYLEENFAAEYTPEKTTTEVQVPEYIPTPLTEGPMAISLEEYKRRVQKINTTGNNNTSIKKKRKRAGKKVQIRKETAILYNELTLASTTAAKQAIIKKFQTNE